MSLRDDSLERPHNRVVAAGPRGRALALAVALMVVGTLGAGWLADNVTLAPKASTSSVMTQQIGFSTVSLITSPSPLRANRAESLLLQVRDASGQAVVGARVSCALSMPDMAMALPPVVASQTAQPGLYACATPPLDIGVWALDVTLTLPTGETGHATFHLSAA